MRQTGHEATDSTFMQIGRVGGKPFCHNRFYIDRTTATPSDPLYIKGTCKGRLLLTAMYSLGEPSYNFCKLSSNHRKTAWSSRLLFFHLSNWPCHAISFPPLPLSAHHYTPLSCSRLCVFLPDSWWGRWNKFLCILLPFHHCFPGGGGQC